MAGRPASGFRVIPRPGRGPHLGSGGPRAGPSNGASQASPRVPVIWVYVGPGGFLSPNGQSPPRYTAVGKIASASVAGSALRGRKGSSEEGRLAAAARAAGDSGLARVGCGGREHETARPRNSSSSSEKEERSFDGSLFRQRPPASGQPKAGDRNKHIVEIFVDTGIHSWVGIPLRS